MGKESSWAVKACIFTNGESRLTNVKLKFESIQYSQGVPPSWLKSKEALLMSRGVVVVVLMSSCKLC